MTYWVRYDRFPCPTCGQTLAVEVAQVERQQTVTCASCNTDLLLARVGAPVESPQAGPYETDPPVTVRLRR